LIQTIGRAARHIHGTAILYADQLTDSMRRAIDETNRRREKQLAFNTQRGITPRGVTKRIRDIIDGVYDAKTVQKEAKAAQGAAGYEAMSETDLAKEIRRLEKQMLEHARNLEFEQAGQVRDQLRALKEKLFGMAAGELPGIPGTQSHAPKPAPARRSRAAGR
jgi:excinuclease ABC subunit B